MDTVITADPFLWSLLVGSLIPVIVALATKLSASSGLKAVLGAVLSVIASIVVTINASSANTFSWKILAYTAATTIIAQITTYVGIWRPVIGVNSVAAPNFGIGPST